MITDCQGFFFPTNENSTEFYKYNIIPIYELQTLSKIHHNNVESFKHIQNCSFCFCVITQHFERVLGMKLKKMSFFWSFFFSSDDIIQFVEPIWSYSEVFLLVKSRKKLDEHFQTFKIMPNVFNKLIDFQFYKPICDTII